MVRAMVTDGLCCGTRGKPGAARARDHADRSKADLLQRLEKERSQLKVQQEKVGKLEAKLEAAKS